MTPADSGPDPTPGAIAAMARACSEIAVEAARTYGRVEEREGVRKEGTVLPGPSHWHSHLMPVTAPRLMEVPSEEMLDEVDRWLHSLGIDSVDRTPLLTGRGLFVVVLGMHRSGTSAVAGSLSHLGLSLTQAQDLMPADAGNPLGYFESTFLSTLDEAINKALYGDWFAPGGGIPSSMFSEELAPFRASMARALSTVLVDAGPVVWKDPRLCTLLPLWRTIIERPTAAVFVYRHPDEVAASLRGRDEFSVDEAYAMWESYNRHALENMGGLPALVVGYREVVEDPVHWVDQAAGFLARLGIVIPGSGKEAALASVHSSLRRARLDADDRSGGLPDSLRDLFGILHGLQGEHVPFVPPDA